MRIKINNRGLVVRGGDFDSHLNMEEKFCIKLGKAQREFIVRVKENFQGRLYLEEIRTEKFIVFVNKDNLKLIDFYEEEKPVVKESYWG